MCAIVDLDTVGSSVMCARLGQKWVRRVSFISRGGWGGGGTQPKFG